jgi:general secretion pathway protein D
MKKQSLNWNKILGCTVTFFFCVVIQIHAGGGGGGGGGRGGGGGGGGRGGGGGAGGGGAFGGGGGGAFGGGAVGGGAGGGRANTSTSTYNNNGALGTASITVDPDTHNLIISTDPVTMEQIKKVIDELDEAKPQVLIKVVFMEIALNNASEIGVQGTYSGMNSAFSGITGFMTNYTVANPGTPTAAIVPTSITPIKTSTTANNNFGLPGTLPGAAGSGGLYSLIGNDFTATLQAIATAGKSTVLSRPSIIARDGQPAQIQVGQDVYLPSSVTYSTAGITGSSSPTINGAYTPIGIILNVTPFIGNNGLVQMILAPSITEIDTSTPGQIIAFGGGVINSPPVFAPNINVRSANTVAITPDGQTVVIGGLISNAKSTGDTKIPLLGDIPLLGSLFKVSTKTAVKQELVIFLTPHIVNAPAQMAMMTGANGQQPSFITNSVSEQELNQFLDKVPVKKN